MFKIRRTATRGYWTKGQCDGVTYGRGVELAVRSFEPNLRISVGASSSFGSAKWTPRRRLLVARIIRLCGFQGAGHHANRERS